MKGCTACYDLTVEFPLPTRGRARRLRQGLRRRRHARGGGADGRRHLSFYEAIPGLLDALPPALQKEVERLRLAPGEATLTAMRQSLRTGTSIASLVRPAVAPTIPHHCSDEFMRSCAALAREFGVGLHSARAGVQGPGDRRPEEIRQDADRTSAGSGAARARFHRGPRRVARRRRHAASRRPRRLGCAQSRQQHAARQRHRRRSGMLDKKLNVGIGTDGASCCDNQNMYESMRLAPMVSKAQGPDTDRWLASERDPRGRDRGQRTRARLRRQARPDRQGLQGRHRVPRPHPHQLDPVQRSHEPAGPYRGRHRRAFRHGRRPDGGREPQARRPRLCCTGEEG